MRVDPGMAEVALDEAADCGGDFRRGEAGGQACPGDLFRHDFRVALLRRASLGPGRVDDPVPEDLRGRDTQGREARFPEHPDEVLRRADGGPPG